MNGLYLLAALLCSALALALAFAPRKAVIAACGVVAAVALAGIASGRLGLLPENWVRIGCSASIAVTAAAAIVLGRTPQWAALGLAANAGLCCGALASVTGSAAPLLALPLALFAFPGTWIAARGYGIGLKVAAGWLIAIGLMTAILPLMTTPGYQKDHME